MPDEQIPIAPGSAGETQNEPDIDELPEGDEDDAPAGRRTPPDDG